MHSSTHADARRAVCLRQTAGGIAIELAFSFFRRHADGDAEQRGIAGSRRAGAFAATMVSKEVP
jgi:hypothetical protein